MKKYSGSSSDAIEKLTLTAEVIQLSAHGNVLNPSLSMSPSNDLTKPSYVHHLNSNNNESGEMASVTWDDIEKVLSSGEYFTPAAISRAVMAAQSDVTALLNTNSTKVFRTKHVSQKNGQHYYVLTNKRDRFYETFRPLQIAVTDLF